MIFVPKTIPPFVSDGSEADCISANETFDGTWPFTPRFYHGNGFAQHYIDEGQGDPILLLHGEPMWGYLYRNFIPVLSKTHRVIVPDHMGFGKSATPQDKEYCLRTHTTNLIGLLESLELEAPLTLFIQDWGTNIGLQFALRYPDKIARIMIGSAVPMPPTLDAKLQRFGVAQTDAHGRIPLQAMPGGRAELQVPPAQAAGDIRVATSSWFPWLLTGLPDDPDYVCPGLASERTNPPRGRTESVLLNIGSSATHVISHLMGMENKSVINETWTRAYSSAFPTIQSSIGALNFPMDAMQQLKLSPEAQKFPHEAVTPENVDALRELPIWVVVGRQDHAISIKSIEVVSQSYGGCPYVVIENAGHFIQEDAPETIVALLQMFIQSTGGARPSFENMAGVPPLNLGRL